MPNYRIYQIDKNDRVIRARKSSRQPTKQPWKPPCNISATLTLRFGTTLAKWDGSAKTIVVVREVLQPSKTSLVVANKSRCVSPNWIQESHAIIGRVKARRNKIRKVLFAFHPQEALQKQRVWVRFAGFD